MRAQKHTREHKQAALAVCFLSIFHPKRRPDYPLPSMVQDQVVSLTGERDKIGLFLSPTPKTARTQALTELRGAIWAKQRFLERLRN